MKKLLLVLAVLWPSVALAQQRPLAATTFTTTDTSADSLHVGCAVGSSTCTGGIKAGGLSVNGVGIVASDGRIPAISSTYFASLSGTNLTGVALLASSNTFTGQPQISNATNGGEWRVSAAGAQVGGLSTPLAVTGSGSASDLLLYVTGATADMYFRTNGANRWSINDAGDLAFGASAHLALSSGVPGITGSVAGTAPSMAGSQTDYSFQLTTGTGNSQITVGFGHTFNSAPTCTPVAENGATGMAFSTSTTALTLATTIPNAVKIHVNCFGF